MATTSDITEDMPVRPEHGNTLTLPDELVLMLLDEDSGFFHQVPGWDLNCAIAGAALAELSLLMRIDTDTESLMLLDSTDTGDKVLDPILQEIAAETTTRDASFWIERLAHLGESIIDTTLERLVEKKILQHHDGDFWTFVRSGNWDEVDGGMPPVSQSAFVKSRIERAVFSDEIPDPRDILLVCLVNTCDVFRFIYELDDRAEERINHICRLDLIGRCIAEAVSQNLAGPLLQYSRLTKKIPVVSIGKLLTNRFLSKGNIPAMFASIAEEYGSVFRLPMSPVIFLAGAETNHWVQRHGRRHLRSRDYFSDFEGIYGAAGVLPGLDGADHFRVRKAMSPGYSRNRLEDQISMLYSEARKYMADWRTGEEYQATDLCRGMINAQISRLFLTIKADDIFKDIAEFKERALSTHLVRVLPKFMLRTPRMKRKAKSIDTLLERVQTSHTPAQRAGCPRDLADDWLSLHLSDPQLVPATNIKFLLPAALFASVYLGDSFSFSLYALASHPDICEKIQQEADALFDKGDPPGTAIKGEAVDVTHRFMLECHRMYPIIPAALRDVMNPCAVEGFDLPVNSRIVVLQSAAHYMEDAFPDPFTFDIDRHLPPRNEYLGRGFAPYGLGTHRCLANRWMELQLVANLLLVARHFRLEIRPEKYKPKSNPFPSMKPSKKLKFLVTEQIRDLDG